MHPFPLNHARRALGVAAVAAAVWGPRPAPALDTVFLTGDQTRRGVLAGYQSGSFRFQTVEGERLRLRQGQVQRIVLDPSAAATIKMRNRRKRMSGRLLGYEKPSLLVETDGERLEISLATVAAMDVELSLDRGKLEDPGRSVISTGETVNITNFVRKGAVTVVHFHSESSVPSVRNAAYLGSLAAASEGGMRVVQITVPGWEAPVARQYGIASLPQFWFFTRDGKLARKLTERFSPVDIDAAMETVLP